MVQAELRDQPGVAILAPVHVEHDFAVLKLGVRGDAELVADRANMRSCR